MSLVDKYEIGRWQVIIPPDASGVKRLNRGDLHPRHPVHRFPGENYPSVYATSG